MNDEEIFNDFTKSRNLVNRTKHEYKKWYKHIRSI
jgi:uncharacterized membrane-anchored protein YhcB (DUF1043 family)